MTASVNRSLSGSILRAFGVLLFLAGIASAADLKPIQPFLQAHCYDCHDGNSAKGGLDLEKLDADLTKPGPLAKWVRIYDRVAKGEMPPPKKAKAAEPQKPAFLASLNTSLTQASAGQANQRTAPTGRLRCGRPCAACRHAR